jgi:myo-inositol-1(or 4)-monophosphatase
MLAPLPDESLIAGYAPSERSRAMLRAALAGGEVARRAFHRHAPHELVTKHARDFQTEADRASERAIAASLSAAFPDAAIWGEEGEADVAADRAVRFLIDPIDGTTNFAWGIPFFAIAIALEENGETAAGVVLDPIHAEAFVAERDKGSFLNGARLAMNETVAPEAAIIGASLPIPGQVKTVPVANYHHALRWTMDTASGVRRLGSAALSLCYVAAGRHDAFFEDGLSPLDYAAAVLVVREAGGVVSSFDGRPIQPSGAILAAVRGLHPWLVAQFAA